MPVELTPEETQAWHAWNDPMPEDWEDLTVLTCLNEFPEIGKQNTRRDSFWNVYHNWLWRNKHLLR